MSLPTSNLATEDSEMEDQSSEGRQNNNPAAIMNKDLLKMACDSYFDDFRLNRLILDGIQQK